MGQEQLVTANIHYPKVQELRVHSSGAVVVELGNGGLAQSVDIFFENLDALKNFIKTLALETTLIEQAPALEALSEVDN